MEASIRLMVVSERPSDSLIRLFWNCKDDGVLSGRVAQGDIFELGDTRVVTPEEPEAPGLERFLNARRGMYLFT